MPPVVESAAWYTQRLPLWVLLLGVAASGGGSVGILRVLGADAAVGAFELAAVEERLTTAIDDRVGAEAAARSADIARQSERYDEIIRRLDRIETRMDK